ncbi:MAG: hypothetical protein V4612_04590 [Pseudomonadota bacterium]
MDIIANILSAIGSLIILLCAFGFMRSKDVFLSVKLVFIANIYGLSILLIGLFLETPTIILGIKTIILLTLNIIITIIINHLIVKKSAIENKIIK